jgi:hypothetical protein
MARLTYCNILGTRLTTVVDIDTRYTARIREKRAEIFCRGDGKS